MSRIIVQLLDMLRPELTTTLIDDGRFHALRETARLMAPVARIGFEYNLQTGRLDFHQQLLRAECDSLVAHAERMRDASHREDACAQWKRITNFGRAWHHEPALRPVRDVWLEFDMDDALERVPSWYVGLDRDESPASVRAAVHAAISFLANDLPAAFDATIEPLPARAWSHVGMMSARGSSAVRLLARCPSADSVHELSSRIGDPRAERLAQTARDFAAVADEFRVAIDVHDTVETGGIEIMIDDRKPDMWSVVLSLLSQMDLCTGAQAAALQAWPCHMAPGSAPWPDALLIAELHDRSRLPVVRRLLRHLKISLSHDRSVQAKAYFSCHHACLP